MAKVGIIGGSGLDNPKLLQAAIETDVETPYGKPSSLPTAGKIEGVDVVIISRHGKEHQFSPTQVNFRANIHALKELGATHIVATTACGSLREEIGRGDFVLMDQFIDFTKHRINTFHESFEKEVVHTPMAAPFDAELRKIVYNTSAELGYTTHNGGTMVTIEGPRFSTRAESNMFRMWGADVINMSTATEVALANEAGIPYVGIAMSTDYDCWKVDEAPVSWDEILEVFNKNADNVIQLIKKSIPKIL